LVSGIFTVKWTSFPTYALFDFSTSSSDPANCWSAIGLSTDQRMVRKSLNKEYIYYKFQPKYNLVTMPIGEKAFCVSKIPTNSDGTDCAGDLDGPSAPDVNFRF